MPWPWCLFGLGRAAATAVDETVGNQDLGGHQVGVFHMIDDLGGGLEAQREGGDIHTGEWCGGHGGVEGIVEREDGDILRNPQTQVEALLFQQQSKNVIVCQNGTGAVLPGKQGLDPVGAFVGGIDEFQTDGGIDLQSVLHHGKLEACLPVPAVEKAAAAAEAQKLEELAKLVTPKTKIICQY